MNSAPPRTRELQSRLDRVRNDREARQQQNICKAADFHGNGFEGMEISGNKEISMPSSTLSYAHPDQTQIKSGYFWAIQKPNFHVHPSKSTMYGPWKFPLSAAAFNIRI